MPGCGYWVVNGYASEGAWLPVSRACSADLPLFGGPMVTAGKVLEVGALGLPIVCIQGEDGGARRIYRDHPLAFGADPQPEPIEGALREAAKLAQTITVDQRIEVRAKLPRGRGIWPALKTNGLCT